MAGEQVRTAKCTTGHVWSVPTGQRFVAGQLCECGEKPYVLSPHEAEVAVLEAEVARLRTLLKEAQAYLPPSPYPESLWQRIETLEEDSDGR